MEPHRVVEGGHGHAGLDPGDAVLPEDRLEERVVRGVGERRQVQRGVVRQGREGLHPHHVAVLGLGGRLHIDGRGDVADVERPGPGPLLGHGVVDAAQHVRRRGQVLRPGHSVRHGHLVVQRAAGGLLEGAGQGEDGLLVLGGQHPADGEGAAVPQRLDGERDGLQRVPGADEVAVERVGGTGGRHRAGGGRQRLGEHLAAEHPAVRLPGGRAREADLTRHRVRRGRRQLQDPPQRFGGVLRGRGRADRCVTGAGTGMALRHERLSFDMDGPHDGGAARDATDLGQCLHDRAPRRRPRPPLRRRPRCAGPRAAGQPRPARRRHGHAFARRA
ncbi:hypothetical protein MICRO11B_200082 [Micrococcus luteus]|nr:hypothetical protein MICRO11B_200082 [Micrococcus luteus]